MKFKAIALALIASATLSLPTFAQSPSAQGKPERVKKEACMKGGFDKSECRQQAGQPVDKMHRPNREEKLMEGILLTLDQQKKVDALRADMKKDFKKAEDKAKKVREKASKERKQKMEKMDKELKKILTPEQYAQYEANKKQLKADKQGKCPKGENKGFKGKKDGKGPKDCNGRKRSKGHKGQKGNKHSFDKGQKCSDCKKDSCTSAPAPGATR